MEYANWNQKNSYSISRPIEKDIFFFFHKTFVSSRLCFVLLSRIQPASLRYKAGIEIISHNDRLIINPWSGTDPYLSQGNLLGGSEG